MNLRSHAGAVRAGDARSLMHLVPLIRQRLGIVIQEHQREDLSKALADAAERFSYASPLALAERFAALDEAAPALAFLVSRITVGESFFFRDAAQMAYLREELLPALVKRRQGDGSRTLRIWSAAASQGQELYSVAMLLRELLPEPAPWHLHLLGTDIDAEALAAAPSGQYREWSLRGVDSNVRMRWFRPTAVGWQVRPEVRAMTRFAYLNLAADTTYPSAQTDTHSMDLILCRNVFIYFEPTLVRRILARLVACLAPGGVLLLGPSDIIDTRIEGLETLSRAGTCVYRKPTGIPAPRAGSGSAPPVAPPAATPPPTRLAALLQEAKALGNAGRHTEALEQCALALALAPTDRECHFLQALLLIEAGTPATGEAALRRALFLDPSFIEAHYQLGMLLVTEGQRPRGLKSLRNALALAERSEDPSRHLSGGPQLTIRHLIEILRNEVLKLERAAE